jgi:HCOMODA/2-hydroxy-3-carboxy-muconic semialdehyde decarboxylase
VSRPRRSAGPSGPPSLDAALHDLVIANLCLMRGHGAAVATREVKATVFVSIHLMLNAMMLREARDLGQQITPLSEGEIRLTAGTTLSELRQARAWEYWARRAGFTTTVND